MQIIRNLIFLFLISLFKAPPVAASPLEDSPVFNATIESHDYHKTMKQLKDWEIDITGGGKEKLEGF